MKRVLILGIMMGLISSVGNYSTSSSILKASTNNIDGGALNFSDTSQDDVISYYDGVDGLKGDNLKEELNSIISSDTYSVSDGKVWDWMKITDRDWDISNPIKESTYNFTRDSNYYFHNLYASYNGDASRAVNREMNVTGSTFVDREHCWPKSLGFKLSSTSSFVKPAGTDLHHLMASDHNNNNKHSNYAYGEVDTSKSYDSVDDKDSQGNSEPTGLLGYSKLWNNSDAKVYEPADEYKGDVARACLYMATRYQEPLGTTSADKPNLTLVDSTKNIETDSNIDNNGIGYYGELTTLLKWNESDPVDSYEIHRNNLIYNNVQNNRNPYIDHPEWARIVYDSSYTGSGATNSAPVSPTDTYQVKNISKPGKETFSLGEEFTCDGLDLTIVDIQGNETTFSSEDENILDNLSYDTMVLGRQTVYLEFKGNEYDLYSIDVTNNGAVIGDQSGQITAREQAQAFANYVVKIGTDHTSDSDVYNKLKSEYDYMDSASQELFNTDESFSESHNLYQTILNNNESYNGNISIPEIISIIAIVFAVAIIIVSFVIYNEKHRKRNRKRH